LEKGAVPVRILHWYDETLPGGRKAGHKPHIICAFGHPHWLGFVVEIDDGRTALIGQHCAREHFGDEVIDNIKGKFDAEQDRQYQVRRLLAIRDIFPDAIAELRGVAQSIAIIGFDAYIKTMYHGLGKMARELAISVREYEGRLIATEAVYDEAATVEAAKSVAKWLVRDTDEPSLFEQTEVDDADQRLAAVARWQQFLARQSKRYRRVPLDMGPCDGWQLLTGRERAKPSTLISSALKLAEGQASRIQQQETEKWTNVHFAEMRNAVTEMFEKLDEAANLAASLLRLAGSANLVRIAAWAQQVERMDGLIGQNIKADGGALIGNTVSVELPPEYRWPPTPQLERLRAAFKVPTDGAEAKT
jgi:hypothetical protein